MTLLPIDQILAPLRQSLARHNRCLLVAQPGAGKTTRVPLALLEDTAPGQRWLLLEPRRVATRLAASYMASQLGEQVGQTVGYRVRGESRVSSQTRLEVLTQGILTRMLQDDPSLPGVAGLIFDEFHERSLDADLGLALALDAQQALRDDMKLLVMSATLDTQALLQLLGEDTPLIECPGRSWPVTTFYRSASRQETEQTLQSRVVLEAMSTHQGDLLVFLPGQGEIRRLQQLLAQSLRGDVDVLPLHGQMPLAQQQAVLRREDDSRRRIILTTALAESSVTVPGVRIVIDCGRERLAVYQPRTGLTRLETRRVNKASADQRRGRAGREAAGFCYRLWPEDTVLNAHRQAEIQQADLAGLVYELARWGVHEPEALSWITPPPAPAWQTARQLLIDLQLLQDDSQLSALGRRCARWPSHPRLARMQQMAVEFGDPALPKLAAKLVNWLEENRSDTHVDLSITLKIDREQLAALLLTAYPDRVACRQSDGQFKLLSGGQARVAADNRLARTELIIVVELDGQAAAARVYSAVELPESVLATQYPDTSEWQPKTFWHDGTQKMMVEEQRLLKVGTRQLTLARRPSKLRPKDLPESQLQQALIEALRKRGTLPWSDPDQQVLGRLRLLHKVLGDPWPSVAEQDLLDSLETWLAPHLKGLHRLDQIARLPLAQCLLQSLDWQCQQRIEQLTPTHIKVPSGSTIRIDYSEAEPVLAVKLQEMFGQTETPRIVGGKVALLIHLLSPARRPVQVTRDLAGFWASSYFAVRKDLRGRYPKHPWPEDPLQAQATARTKAAQKRSDSDPVP
jgi:ATP-dependent helicase HrpB